MRLILPQNRTRKPQQGFVIDRDHPLMAGIVGWWPFVEKSGLVAKDYSSSKNNGTLMNGPVWTAENAGSALKFDGVTDYVNLGNPSVLNLDDIIFTASAWVRTSVGGYVVSKGGGNVSPSGGWTLGTEAILTKVSSASNAYTRINSATITDNKWHHICAVGKYSTSGTSGQAFDYYTDGVLTNGAETNVQATYSSSSISAVIGARSYSGGIATPSFNGMISDVRIWNRGLSASEIKLLYDKPLIGFANPSRRYVGSISSFPVLSSLTASYITSSGGRLTAN